MAEIEFTNVAAQVRDGNGQTYFWTYKGREYYTEEWWTSNGSGEDIYDGVTDGHFPVVNPLGVRPSPPFETEQDEDEYLDKLDNVKRAWGHWYSEFVGAAMRQTVERTLQDIGVEVDTESSASRQHYVETGRYLRPDEVLTDWDCPKCKTHHRQSNPADGCDDCGWNREN